MDSVIGFIKAMILVQKSSKKLLIKSLKLQANNN